MKTIYFIRHGQAEGNSEKIFKLPTAALTELGHQQSKFIAERIQSLPITALISGPLKRTIQTAEHIRNVTGLPIEIEDCFSGIKFASSMHGKLKNGPEAKKYFENLKRCYEVTGAKYEDAESYTDLHKRIELGLTKLATHPEEHILVVSHESLIKSILIFILHQGAQTPSENIDFKNVISSMSNTSISTFTFDKTSWHLEMWNDHAHFAE